MIPIALKSICLGLMVDIQFEGQWDGNSQIDDVPLFHLGIDREGTQTQSLWLLLCLMCKLLWSQYNDGFLFILAGWEHLRGLFDMGLLSG